MAATAAPNQASMQDAACEGAQDAANAFRNKVDERRRGGGGTLTGSPRAGSAAGSSSLECAALWNSYNCSFASSPGPRGSQSLFMPSPKRSLVFSPGSAKSIDAWLLSPKTDHVAPGGRGFNDIFSTPFPASSATPAQRSGQPGLDSLQRLRMQAGKMSSSPDLHHFSPLASGRDDFSKSSAVQDTIKAFLASPDKGGPGGAMGSKRQAAEDVWLRSRKRSLSEDFPSFQNLPKLLANSSPCMLPPFSSPGEDPLGSSTHPPNLLDHLTTSPPRFVGRAGSMVSVPLSPNDPADSLAWCNSINICTAAAGPLDSLLIAPLFPGPAQPQLQQDAADAAEKPRPGSAQGGSPAVGPTGSGQGREVAAQQCSLQTPPHYTRLRGRRPASTTDGQRSIGHKGQGAGKPTVKMEPEPEQQQQQQTVQLQLFAQEQTPVNGEDGGNTESSSPEPMVEIPTRRCNCKKSQCLKLYCDCFSAQQYCSGCACTHCKNSKQFSDLVQDRQASIKSRDPLAFEKKIQVAQAQHKRGCNCKKSNCLKKYCECFQGSVACGAHCKCYDCKNLTPPEPPAPKSGSRPSSRAGSASQEAGSLQSGETGGRPRQVSSGAVVLPPPLALAPLDSLLALHQRVVLNLGQLGGFSAPFPPQPHAGARDAGGAAADEDDTRMCKKRQIQPQPQQQAQEQLDAAAKPFTTPAARLDLHRLPPLSAPLPPPIPPFDGFGPRQPGDFPTTHNLATSLSPFKPKPQDLDGPDQDLLCGETSLEPLPDASFHTPRAGAGCDLTPAAAAFYSLGAEFDFSPQCLRDLSSGLPLGLGLGRAPSSHHMHCLLSPLRDTIRSTPQQLPSPLPSHPPTSSASPLTSFQGTQLPDHFSGFKPQSPMVQVDSLRFFSPSGASSQVLFSLVSSPSPSQGSKAASSQDREPSSSNTSGKLQAAGPGMGMGSGDRVHCLLTPVRIPMGSNQRLPQPVEAAAAEKERPDPQPGRAVPAGPGAAPAAGASLCGAVAVITLGERGGAGDAAKAAAAAAAAKPCASLWQQQQQQQQVEGSQLPLPQPAPVDPQQLLRDFIMTRLKAIAQPATTLPTGTMLPPPAPAQQQQAPAPGRPSVRPIRAPPPSQASRQSAAAAAAAAADDLSQAVAVSSCSPIHDIWSSIGAEADADPACASPYPLGFFNCVFTASSPHTQPRQLDAAPCPPWPPSHSPSQRRLGPGMLVVRPSLLRRASKRPRGEDDDAIPSASQEDGEQ